MKITERLGLNLPEGSDYVNIETLNENFRKLDSLTPGKIGAAVTATYTATVTTSWTASGDYYYQDIEVTGILEADDPIVDILAGSDNDANKLYSDCICKVLHITTSDNSIRVWATDAISTAFPVQLKVVR